MDDPQPTDPEDEGYVNVNKTDEKNDETLTTKSVYNHDEEPPDSPPESLPDSPPQKDDNIFPNENSTLDGELQYEFDEFEIIAKEGGNELQILSDEEIDSKTVELFRKERPSFVDDENTSKGDSEEEEEPKETPEEEKPFDITEEKQLNESIEEKSDEFSQPLEDSLLEEKNSRERALREEEDEVENERRRKSMLRRQIEEVDNDLEDKYIRNASIDVQEKIRYVEKLEGFNSDKKKEKKKKKKKEDVLKIENEVEREDTDASGIVSTEEEDKEEDNKKEKIEMKKMRRRKTWENSLSVEQRQKIRKEHREKIKEMKDQLKKANIIDPNDEGDEDEILNVDFFNDFVLPFLEKSEGSSLDLLKESLKKDNDEYVKSPGEMKSFLELTYESLREEFVEMKNFRIFIRNLLTIGEMDDSRSKKQMRKKLLKYFSEEEIERVIDVDKKLSSRKREILRMMYVETKTFSMGGKTRNRDYYHTFLKSFSFYVSHIKVYLFALFIIVILLLVTISSLMLPIYLDDILFNGGSSVAINESIILNLFNIGVAILVFYFLSIVIDGIALFVHFLVLLVNACEISKSYTPIDVFRKAKLHQHRRIFITGACFPFVTELLFLPLFVVAIILLSPSDILWTFRFLSVIIVEFIIFSLFSICVIYIRVIKNREYEKLSVEMRKISPIMHFIFFTKKFLFFFGCFNVLTIPFLLLIGSKLDGISFDYHIIFSFVYVITAMGAFMSSIEVLQCKRLSNLHISEKIWKKKKKKKKKPNNDEESMEKEKIENRKKTQEIIMEEKKKIEMKIFFVNNSFSLLGVSMVFVLLGVFSLLIALQLNKTILISSYLLFAPFYISLIIIMILSTLHVCSNTPLIRIFQFLHVRINLVYLKVLEMIGDNKTPVKSIFYDYPFGWLSHKIRIIFFGVLLSSFVCGLFIFMILQSVYLQWLIYYPSLYYLIPTLIPFSLFVALFIVLFAIDSFCYIVILIGKIVMKCLESTKVIKKFRIRQNKQLKVLEDRNKFIYLCEYQFIWIFYVLAFSLIKMSLYNYTTGAIWSLFCAIPAVSIMIIFSLLLIIFNIGSFPFLSFYFVSSQLLIFAPTLILICLKLDNIFPYDWMWTVALIPLFLTILIFMSASNVIFCISFPRLKGSFKKKKKILEKEEEKEQFLNFERKPVLKKKIPKKKNEEKEFRRVTIETILFFLSNAFGISFLIYFSMHLAFPLIFNIGVDIVLCFVGFGVYLVILCPYFIIRFITLLWKLDWEYQEFRSSTNALKNASIAVRIENEKNVNILCDVSDDEDDGKTEKKVVGLVIEEEEEEVKGKKKKVKGENGEKKKSKEPVLTEEIEIVEEGRDERRERLKIEKENSYHKISGGKHSSKMEQLFSKKKKKKKKRKEMNLLDSESD